MNDMLDKSWFQHRAKDAFRALINTESELPNQHRLGLLSEQSARLRHKCWATLRPRKSILLFLQTQTRALSLSIRPFVVIYRQSGSNRNISSWPQAPCSHAKLPHWEDWAKKTDLLPHNRVLGTGAQGAAWFNLRSPGTSITPGCMMQTLACPLPGRNVPQYSYTSTYHHINN